jgi:hypothetical protein
MYLGMALSVDQAVALVSLQVDCLIAGLSIRQFAAHKSKHACVNVLECATLRYLGVSLLVRHIAARRVQHKQQLERVVCIGVWIETLAPFARKPRTI